MSRGSARQVERILAAVVFLAAGLAGCTEPPHVDSGIAVGDGEHQNLSDFHTEDVVIEIRVGAEEARPWTVTPSLSPDTLRVPCRERESTAVVFASSREERSFALTGSEALEFHVALPDGTRAHTRIECVPPRVRYRGDYGVDAPLAERDLATELGSGTLAGHLREIVETRKVPGLSVIVVEGDEVVFQDAYGVASISPRAEMTAESSARLASATKVLTGLVFLSAAEDGWLDLDAALEEVLPETPEAWRGVRLWQILSHRSGLPQIVTELDELTEEEKTALTHREIFERLAPRSPDFEPGSNFRYQQSGYSLLAMILMERTGKSWDELLHEHVLDPAGMRNTVYGDSLGEHPAGYDLIEGELVEIDYYYPRAISTAGGYNTTAGDLGRLFRALAAGTIVDLQRWQDEVLTDTRLPDGSGYGLATIVKRFGETVTFGHSGGGGLADVRYAPAERIGIGVLTNRGSSDVAYDISDEIAEVLFGPPPE